MLDNYPYLLRHASIFCLLLMGRMFLTSRLVEEAANLVTAGSGSRQQLLWQHFGCPRTEDCLTMELEYIKKIGEKVLQDHIRSILFAKLSETVNDFIWEQRNSIPATLLLRFLFITDQLTYYGVLIGVYSVDERYDGLIGSALLKNLQDRDDIKSETLYTKKYANSNDLYILL